MNDPTTFLDFFSGVGVLRKDFELCGMVCKGHREIDKFAVRSFRSIYDIKADGRKVQKVRIEYNFVGKIPEIAGK